MHLGELTDTPPPELPRDVAVWQSALVTGLGRIISARHFLESLVFLLPSPYEKKNRTKSPGILQRGIRSGPTSSTSQETFLATGSPIDETPVRICISIYIVSSIGGASPWHRS